MIRVLRRRHGKSEATRAREKAERDLATIRAETPTYAALGVALREIRERNHFGDLIAQSFRGGTP